MGEWYDPYWSGTDDNWYDMDPTEKSSWWLIGEDGEHKSIYHEDIYLHFVLRSFVEENSQVTLVDEISTKTDPSNFQYSMGGGWSSFPPGGLGPSLHGATVRGRVYSGRFKKVFFQVGVEPSLVMTEDNIGDGWWNI